MICAWCKSPIQAGPHLVAAGTARPAPTSHGMCRACLEVRVRPQGLGFASEGPGFYVWDEDRAEVVGVARDLQRITTPRPGRLAAWRQASRKARPKVVA